jgi:hypothetical protein
VLLSDERFVEFADEVLLSWENVREPVITEHNGKKTTLGGNTVIYIVSPDGTVADAFPGVYRPDEVMASFEAAAAIALQPADARDKYHRQRASKAVAARINMSKAFVESHVLDAKGVGERLEVPTDAGVVDLSHLAMTREKIRESFGISEGLPEDEAMARVITMDSRNNMWTLRPLVHDFLIGKRATPAEIRNVIFKEFLAVHIDDRNLGIK